MRTGSISLTVTCACKLDRNSHVFHLSKELEALTTFLSGEVVNV
jgi:hypothetical protein